MHPPQTKAPSARLSRVLRELQQNRFQHTNLNTYLGIANQVLMLKLLIAESGLELCSKW